jgi:predicted DNA-binding antitoxin AbrB/MazE fold protein
MSYLGVAKGKIIELREKLPLPEGTQVKVSISLLHSAETAQLTLQCAGMLSDLTEDQRTAYEEELNRRLRFLRRLPVL